MGLKFLRFVIAAGFRASFCMLAFGAFAATPVSLENLEDLANYCWLSSADEAGGRNSHCFTWVDGGRALLDRQSYMTGERPFAADVEITVEDADARKLRFDLIQAGIPRKLGNAIYAEREIRFDSWMEETPDGQVYYTIRWNWQTEDQLEISLERKLGPVSELVETMIYERAAFAPRVR